MDQTCPKWIKPVQIGLDLSKLDQICPNWTKPVQIGSNLSKMDQICSSWIKSVQIGLDLLNPIGGMLWNYVVGQGGAIMARVCKRRQKLPKRPSSTQNLISDKYYDL